MNSKHAGIDHVFCVVVSPPEQLILAYESPDFTVLYTVSILKYTEECHDYHSAPEPFIIVLCNLLSYAHTSLLLDRS